MKEKDVISLINELEDASEKYYLSENDGPSPLTDEEFDSKIEFLEEIKTSGEFSELFKEGSKGALLIGDSVSLGAEVSSENTFTHRRKMLSLKKAKTQDELIKFLKKMDSLGSKGFNLQAKLDGFALSAHYDNNGEISRLVTRGDGEVGEDVSYLIEDRMASIINLPDQVNSQPVSEIRGEIFFTESQFQKVNESNKKTAGQYYKNSRNAVVGLMAKSRLGLDFSVEFTFGIYSVISKDGRNISLEEFSKKNNFKTVSDLTREQVGDLEIENLELDSTFEAVEKFGKLRKNFTIPTDGVVIKPSNESEMQEKLGDGTSYPNSQIAFKYPGESSETELIGVDITVGRTGKINPVGRLKPVLLNGTVISNVSLHNYAWIGEKGLSIGDTVSITRANDVIPYLKAVVLHTDDGEKIEVPDRCPSCESVLFYEGEEYPPMTLLCKNFECPSKNLFSLYSAVGKNVLDIDGMSRVTIDYLHSIGKMNNISDLYNLSLDDLKKSHFGKSTKGNPRTLGESRSKNILEHIEKSKKASLDRWLMAISINGMGREVSRNLVKNFKNIETITSLSKNDLMKIEGIGDRLSGEIIEGLKRKRSLIEKLKGKGVLFGESNEKKSDEVEEVCASRLNGLSFSISGAVPDRFSNRTDFVNFLEDNGAVFHSSPKMSTDYFIGDEEGSSSKVRKAKEFNLEFVKPEDFEDRFLFENQS